VRSVREGSRETAVSAQSDVVVVGGGPAGIAAAVASARCGASTVLIEQHGFLGGMATAGLVGPFAGVRHRYGGGRIVGGVPWQLIERLRDCGGAIIPPLSSPPYDADGCQQSNAGTQGEGTREDPGARQADAAREGAGTREGEGERKGVEPGSERSARGDVPFDPEILKWVAERMAIESGVDLRYHRFFSNVLKDGSHISALLVESKSGREAFVGRVVVDATGDADVAERSEAPYEKGREEDGALQPMSLMFRLGGVDTDTLGDIDAPYVSSRIRRKAKQLRQEGKLPPFGGPWTFWGSTFRRGEVMVNMVRLLGDGTDSDALTRNEIEGRDHMHQFLAFLKEHVSEFSSAFLIDSGSHIGVRESRRIQGVYRLAVEDVIDGREFPDSIALGGHVIDVHSPSGTADQIRYRVAPYQIPLRCLIPPSIDNLLVAGRPVSADHGAHASLRVQGTCMATGQAAGITAALAAGNRLRPIDVPVRHVQDTLERWGAPFKAGLEDGEAAEKKGEERRAPHR